MVPQIPFSQEGIILYSPFGEKYPFKVFKVSCNKLIDIQGFQGPLFCFQGFQGFQGPADTLLLVYFETVAVLGTTVYGGGRYFPIHGSQII